MQVSGTAVDLAGSSTYITAEWVVWFGTSTFETTEVVAATERPGGQVGKQAGGQAVRQAAPNELSTRSAPQIREARLIMELRNMHLASRAPSRVAGRVGTKRDRGRTGHFDRASKPPRISKAQKPVRSEMVQTPIRGSVLNRHDRIFALQDVVFATLATYMIRQIGEDIFGGFNGSVVGVSKGLICMYNSILLTVIIHHTFPPTEASLSPEWAHLGPFTR
ncbi:hypothetical protein GQ53DRAFT_351047 [Thozetella sp. PMI_491]|nr:hypothetical protein GQ53DRAFT_351047 [Thozetella sp. PMI_491]